MFSYYFDSEGNYICFESNFQSHQAFLQATGDYLEMSVRFLRECSWIGYILVG
jgi:hypothetical protein